MQQQATVLPRRRIEQPPPLRAHALLAIRIILAPAAHLVIARFEFYRTRHSHMHTHLVDSSTLSVG